MDDDELHVDYQALADDVLEGLTNSQLEYRLVFEGMNEARNGSPVVVEVYRLKFSPSEQALIADDFGWLTLTGTLVKDESKAGTSTSQYFRQTIAKT